MNRTYRLLFLALLSIVFAQSCTQPEGLGGNSHIKGVLIERFYNEDLSVFQYQAPAKDEDVFINFGNETIVGQKTATSYNGEFKFSYLWPGNYKLYYYTDDTLSKAKNTIINEFSLEKNSTKHLDTLYFNTILDWNDGYASIKGKIRLINYKNESKFPNLEIKDIGPAQDIDVYLIYNNQSGYTERVRTLGDGTYCFNNLIKGKYKVFFYSENVKEGKTENFIKLFEINIIDINQSIELEEVTIEKI